MCLLTEKGHDKKMCYFIMNIHKGEKILNVV